ncbi:type II secretion system F family protein [Phenylobacterium sp.]|uniref:type II secretion system F family protein n=1 Tax=Phenylobacterium sp. TaxID=1871053 RepID=UPI0039195FFA
MDFSQTMPGILSLALIVGGGALLFHTARENRRVLAGRLELVMSETAQPVPEEHSAMGDALLRITSGHLDDADLAEVTRLTSRFGIGKEYAAMAFAAARLISAGLMAALVLLLMQMSGRTGPSAVLAAVLLAPVSVAGGWFLPLLIVRYRMRQRAAEVSQGLPEALELLVVCVEAGLALEDGLDRIILELRRTQPVLAEELEATSADLKILPDRNAAFRKLAERVGSPSVRSVVTTLSQTLRYGTPLAGALRVAASELRNDALIALEERANRLPSLLTVPMMVFILPTIFLVLAGPVVIRLLDVLRP